jgi:ABC-type nitrate/sulfonate/bicarbonate transport system permease component
MSRDKVLIHSIQFAIVAILFGTWYFVAQSNQRLLLLLPPPELVWIQMKFLWNSGRLGAAAMITVVTIIKAYAIAVVAGILVGFLVTRSRNLVRIFEPVLAGVFAVPLTLFFPLFVVFFGIGPDSKVAYGATYAFFPIVLNTIAGFSSVDELYLRAVRSMGANSVQQFRHVYLPGALPVTLTGLRIAFVICIASVLGGETLAAAAGIGKSIALAAELMETARLYAWIAFVVIVSVMINLLVLAAESRTERE